MRRVIGIVSAAVAGLTLAGCAGEPKRLAAPIPKSAPICADFSFPIYFETGSDELTASARAVVDIGVQQVRGCRVSKIEVLGLADADGPKRRNLELSRRRAARVAKALTGEGLPAPVFDIEAIGAAGARAPDGEPEPLRRRTEVVVHASPPGS
jgi:peptidoglycan-associated lipoprotein